MKQISIVCLLIWSICSVAQEEQKNVVKKTVVKYRQYEKFDLGNLAVEGEIVAPGDITVNEEQIRGSTMIYKRINFLDRILDETRGF